MYPSKGLELGRFLWPCPSIIAQPILGRDGRPTQKGIGFRRAKRGAVRAAAASGGTSLTARSGGRTRRRAARRRPVQKGPGLGLERVELLVPSRVGQVRMIAPPPDGAVEVGARRGDPAELDAGPWPGRTGRRRRTRPWLAARLFSRVAMASAILARAVLGDAQRVEVDGRIGRQLDRLPGQGQRLLRDRARQPGRWPASTPGCCSTRDGAWGARWPASVGLGLLSVAQPIMDLARAARRGSRSCGYVRYQRIEVRQGLLEAVPGGARSARGESRPESRPGSASRTLVKSSTASWSRPSWSAN